MARLNSILPKPLAATIILFLVAGLAPAFAQTGGESASSAKTAEEILAPVRGPYTKTLDTEAGECEVAAYESPTEGGGGQDESLFVPVHEIGLLLTLNQDTNRLTGEARAVALQICMELKAIRRVAYAMEEKELVNDPNARKAASKAIASSTKSAILQLAEGRAQSPVSVGTGKPNTVQKTAGYVENASQNKSAEIENARAAFKDDYKQSNNILKIKSSILWTE
jgi:hypothetical protein